MTAVLTTITGAFTLLEKSLKFIVAPIILGILFMLLPFKVEIPSDIFNFFVDNLRSFASTLAFLVPVKFLFLCISTLLILKFSSLIVNLINWVYNKFV